MSKSRPQLPHLLFALALLAGGIPAHAAAAGSTVAALGNLVRSHHPLQLFEGAVTWYEYLPPPTIGYARPDFDSWAAGLTETAAAPDAARFNAIWRDGDGAIRYVLSHDRGGGTRLFSIDGNTIEFEDPGFHTQVGVARWGWVYEEGRLRTHRTWRLALGPPDEEGRPTGPPAPTALFAVIDYEYARGRDVPSRSRTYWSEEDRRAGRWGQKSSYDAAGRLEKTKHNKERPYPY